MTKYQTSSSGLTKEESMKKNKIKLSDKKVYTNPKTGKIIVEDSPEPSYQGSHTTTELKDVQKRLENMRKTNEYNKNLKFKKK